MFACDSWLRHHEMVLPRFPLPRKFILGMYKVSGADLPSVNERQTGRKVWSVSGQMATVDRPFPLAYFPIQFHFFPLTLFDFTTKCEKIYVYRDGRRAHILLQPPIHPHLPIVSHPIPRGSWYVFPGLRREKRLEEWNTNQSLPKEGGLKQRKERVEKRRANRVNDGEG